MENPLLRLLALIGVQEYSFYSFQIKNVDFLG